jgi:CheY-like chemotaxis protein
MLGGEIHLTSTPGSGSTFTFYLPRSYVAGKVVKRIAPEPRPENPAPIERDLELPPDGTVIPNEIGDDRNAIEPGDFILLIVDNDRAFASFMIEVAHDAGMKVVATARGGTAIALVRQFRPLAILLDIKLEDIEGWRVLRSVKNDFATRHIPVQVLSNDDDRQRAMHEGAFGMLTKPVDRAQLERVFADLRGFTAPGRRRLLVVEDDRVQRDRIIELVGGDDVDAVQVATGEEALLAAGRERFDCVVLDLGLPDVAGLTVAERLEGDPAGRFLPIVVFTGRDVSTSEQPRLRRVAKAVIVKDGRSDEHLLEEVSLCLHRAYAGMDRRQCAMIDSLHRPEEVLKGRRILVVDDDIRNIFAMTSLLERYEVDVVSAEDGRHAIEILERDRAIELVLMDIMMPEMDGYDTMREIRKNARYTSLPIIALTAKAMKGDREKCLDAGASDYVAKPVDPPHLISLLCVWLYRGAAAVLKSGA